MDESVMRREEDFEEYLSYLYSISAKYSDCDIIDDLIQESMLALLLKLDKGERVDNPRAYIATVLKNKHNEYLRGKYSSRLVEFTDDIAAPDELSERYEREELSAQYERVRREIGRLVRIYREVVVLHYVKGMSVDEISARLGVPRGTVLSRLSAARNQIKNGLEEVMEKYSNISYEPKTASIGIWGSAGLDGEPFSLISSDIETNILCLAYENPVSVRGIADSMGIPAAYIEPIIAKLIGGELLGKTAGALVYTRCFVRRYDDAFGDIGAQERLAEKYASEVIKTVLTHIKPQELSGEFAEMSEKQKGTLLLFLLNQILGEIAESCRPSDGDEIKNPPERPNAGRWLATLTVRERDRARGIKYDGSGPVVVGYAKDSGGKRLLQMFDCQSFFGDAHWAYNKFKYKMSLQSILRFYGSFLRSDIKPDGQLIFELIPEFEKLRILKRDESGAVKLDIPALPFDEVKKFWNPVCEEIKKDLTALLSDDIKELWLRWKNKVPRHIDAAEHFIHSGAVGAYVKAQLEAVVKSGLFPYEIEIGKAPLIYIAYEKEQ